MPDDHRRGGPRALRRVDRGLLLPPRTELRAVPVRIAKVAVNHGHLENRLGAYHASQKVILDFSFLSTLPIARVRNGMAELVKIAVVGNRRVFDLLEAHGEELLHTGFGHREGSTSLRAVDHEVTYEAIRSSSRRKSRCCTADRQLLLRQ
jgi:3-dehydroquinate synthetase